MGEHRLGGHGQHHTDQDGMDRRGDGERGHNTRHEPDPEQACPRTRALEPRVGDGQGGFGPVVQRTAEADEAAHAKALLAGKGVPALYEVVGLRDVGGHDRECRALPGPPDPS